MSGLWAGGGSYQAWADHLEDWADGGTAAVPDPPALTQDGLPADAWQRLNVRITEALGRRLQSWADALVAALAAAPDEFSAGRTLAQSRDGLRQVRAAASHPSLPEDFRNRLLASVDAQIRRLQDDIEAQLDEVAGDGPDPRWREARRRTVRDNRLTQVLAEDPAAAARGAAATWSYDPAANGRRVIGG
ncbi:MULTISPECIES: hypothetical protein [Streptomyces]|uniref:Uncharacterized protein n=1 Tax=Streptomyces clavifer TaxID=68188 RepID=A0ABS4V8E5_9ACTN|nr:MULTISPECIES: hypothetical protein [Streptomyces]KQX77989.1 hypothetical protein ASD26_17540 [Streptomyces sp. Root1319]KQZ10120.1 hypothetical protein ASD51_07515 [Streptomyces sp. Root55]MBP2360171.1 hypothetical protein [Streptomyces clavifer]MDX2743330.1 hypothetical protein [Streptomyces sp. NRRL_B-2557]MDX3066704.1 hypothetical protein [Streptomyces sp. ND04-05B]